MRDYAAEELGCHQTGTRFIMSQTAVEVFDDSDTFVPFGAE